METENKIKIGEAQLPGFISLAKETLKVYKDKWNVLVPLFLMFPIILIILSFAIFATKLISPSAFFLNIIINTATLFIMFLVMSWIHLSIIITAKERYNNIGLIKVLKKAKSKVFAFFWTVALCSITIIGGLIFFGLLGLIFVSPLNLNLDSSIIVITSMGISSFIGIIIAIWVFGAGIIAATEDKRGIAALAQSREYVRGYFFKIFFLMVMGLLLFFSFTLITEAISNNLIKLVANLIIIPIPTIFSYLIFEKLKLIKGNLPEPTTGQKNFFLISAGVGVITIFWVIIISTRSIPDINIDQLKYQIETGQELPRLPM